MAGSPGSRPGDGMRVAVVTGTAQGIGAAIASALEADGVRVFGFDRDRVDITDEGQVESYFAALPQVDILVNNAGGVCGQTFSPLEEVTDESWRAVVDANLTGTFHCTRAVVPGMKRSGWGRIVNISSTAARSAGVISPAYNASKAAMEGMMRGYAARVPLGRFGTPQEVALAVVMTVCNGFVTGQTVAVNGGVMFI